MTDQEKEIDLLRKEASALREQLAGVTAALAGAQRAYAVAAQRADLLEEQLKYERKAKP